VEFAGPYQGIIGEENYRERLMPLIENISVQINGDL